MALQLLSPKFWYELAFAPVEYAPKPGLLRGRAAIVTGSNTGLGLETAVKLAELGPKLIILAVRSVDKGEKARQYLVDKTGIEPSKVEVWQVDLASFDSVKAFAARCTRELDRLDVLVQNAGMVSLAWKLTKDGHEESFQVNVLSVGLLSLLLLPLINKAASSGPADDAADYAPHITIVSSNAHAWAPYTRPKSTSLLLDLDDPASVNGDILARYGVTKFLDVFLARCIATLPSAKGIVCNSVNPNMCKSELRRDLPWIAAWVFNKLAWKTETGAKCIAFAATAATPTGAYVDMTRVAQPSAFCASEAGMSLERDIWKEMAELWAGIEPGIGKVLG